MHILHRMVACVACHHPVQILAALFAAETRPIGQVT